PQFDTYLPAPALRARGLDPVSGRHRRGSAGRRDDRAAISVSRRSYYRRPYGLKASDYGASQRYHELWVARDGGRDPDFPVDVAETQRFGPQPHIDLEAVAGPRGRLRHGHRREVAVDRGNFECAAAVLDKERLCQGCRNIRSLDILDADVTKFDRLRIRIKVRLDPQMHGKVDPTCARLVSYERQRFVEAPHRCALCRTCGQHE